MVEGMNPESWLRSSPRSSKLAKFSMEAGIDPENLLA